MAADAGGPLSPAMRQRYGMDRNRWPARAAAALALLVLGLARRGLGRGTDPSLVPVQVLAVVAFGALTAAIIARKSTPRSMP